MLAAGGRVALGGHGEMQGLQVHWEMRLFAEDGMKPHDFLRVATINGAEALGFAQDLGSVEAGKLADLVALDRQSARRHPFHDIHPLGDEERCPLQWRYAGHRLAPCCRVRFGKDTGPLHVHPILIITRRV